MNEASRQEALLRHRAEQIARPLAREEHGDAITYLGCIVATRRVGLPVENLLGVFHAPRLTPVPGSGRVLQGIAQVRGRLVAVVDLAAALDAPRNTRAALLALVEGAPGQLGLLIDSTERLIEVSSSEHCQHLPSEATAPFVSAVSRELFTLIDLEALLSSPLVRASLTRTTTTSESLSSAPGGPA